MKITFDQNTNQLSIQFNANPSVESEEIYPGVVADFDQNNKICGLDIENAEQYDFSNVTVDVINRKKLG